MSISSNNNTNLNSSHQKLSNRGTPVISPHSKIIRISAKSTPTTNTESHNNTNIYSRITRQQLNHQSIPPKLLTNSLGLSIPKQNTTTMNTSSRLLRSEVVSSTRNWEVECGVLKQTLDYYKNRIVQLENKDKSCYNNSKSMTEKKETQTYRLRLQQTQQRMNEQNAYLRQCLSKLNNQLQKADSILPILQNNQLKLQSRNKSLQIQIQNKSNQLIQLRNNYYHLLQLNKEQKQKYYDNGNKLKVLQQSIIILQQQNNKLQIELLQNKKIISILESELVTNNSKHQYILKGCQEMEKQISMYKHSINCLKQQLIKATQNNQGTKKSIDDESRRIIVSSKSAYFNDSVINDTNKVNHSFIYGQGQSIQNRVSMKKCYSTTIIQQIPNNQQQHFQINQYQQKAEQFRLLKMFVDIQKIVVNENVGTLINLGEYFKQSTDILYNDKLKLRSSIEKYKKLVEISCPNSNMEQQKSQQFITQLIEKCNLYQSSLYQKRNTIDSLQNQLKLFKKQSKQLNKQTKTPFSQIKKKYKYLDKQDQYQKQKMLIHKLSKEVDHLNMKLSESDNGNKKNNTNNNAMNSIKTFQKTKSFRPLGHSLTKQANIVHTKLKNISGQEIVKQMENKLKLYQCQVVPQLQAKISQYKGMLDIFQKQYTLNNSMDDNLQQSRISIISTSNAPIQGSQKKRRRMNTNSFSDFRSSQLKQSTITRPETSDSNISRQRKKRLDELDSDVSLKVLSAITLRLCQICQKMSNNHNYNTIHPSSVYLINYSQQYVGSLKIKILQTPKQKINEIRKYWAPQNLLGCPVGELSVVWNLGVLIDEVIHSRLYFCNEQQISNKQYRYLRSDNMFFKNLLQKMLVKDKNLRIGLKQIQNMILGEEEYLFK